MVEILRPNPPGALQPYELEEALGAKLLQDIPAGEALTWKDLGD